MNHGSRDTVATVPDQISQEKSSCQIRQRLLQDDPDSFSVFDQILIMAVFTLVIKFQYFDPNYMFLCLQWLLYAHVGMHRTVYVNTLMLCFRLIIGYNIIIDDKYFL